MAKFFGTQDTSELTSDCHTFIQSNFTFQNFVFIESTNWLKFLISKIFPPLNAFLKIVNLQKLSHLS